MTTSDDTYDPLRPGTPLTPLTIYVREQVRLGGWHPDDNLHSLVRAGSELPTFTPAQAHGMEHLTRAAFAEASDRGLDLYDLVARALDLNVERN